MPSSPNKLSKRYLLASGILLVSLAQGAFSSELGQGESIVVDSISRSQILTSDSPEAEFSEKGIAKEASKSVGVESVTSDNVDVYVIPLGYGLPISVLGGDEFINLSADLPYVNVELPTGNESGLGDMRVGAEYFIERNNIIFKAAMDIKFPTGDEENNLGSGSTDFGFSLTGRKRSGDIGFNATAGYILRGEATVNSFKRDYGNVITLVGGAEYQLKPSFWVGTNAAFIRSGEDEFSVGGNNPGLQTLDLIPSASFRLNTDMTVVAELIIPIQESLVNGTAGAVEPDREVTMSFGFNSEF